MHGTSIPEAGKLVNGRCDQQQQFKSPLFPLALLPVSLLLFLSTPLRLFLATSPSVLINPSLVDLSPSVLTDLSVCWYRPLRLLSTSLLYIDLSPSCSSYQPLFLSTSLRLLRPLCLFLSTFPPSHDNVTKWLGNNGAHISPHHRMPHIFFIPHAATSKFKCVVKVPGTRIYHVIKVCDIPIIIQNPHCLFLLA